MKLGLYFLPLCLTCVLTAPTKEDAEEALKTLTSLYDIEFETKPEDGTVQGIRIRRNGQSAGKTPAENVDFSLPEIDIQKINDQMISVNGIRLKRSDLSDLSDVEIEKDIQAEATEGEGERNRRTSGADSLLSFLFSKITSKISSLSGASSGHGGDPEPSYGPPVTSYDDKSFNLWEFKKQILNTLLQAVKAIKGGVIAIGGQIVKAKGQLISSAGKIVATKGDAISGFGRHIASSAFHHPAPTHHVSPTAFATASVDHVPDTGYPPSGYPAPTYGVPTIPSSYSPTVSSSYGVPTGYNKRGAPSNQFGELSNGVQAGLLVLKPIDSSPYIKPRGAHDFRDTLPSHSEHKPVMINNLQSRSYFVRY